MTVTTDPNAVADFRESVYHAVEAERDRQDAKWGEQNHADDYWLGIAMEEVGEVAKAVIERNDLAVQEEITQTVAVFLGWLEAINRRPVRACRVCGCTEEHGCLEGCWWVEPDLCSSCQGAEAVTP